VNHDHCAPIAGLPFSRSAPVLDETVTFTSGPTGTITTRGDDPGGQSSMIEVDLFGGPTGGPWTVAVDDLFEQEFCLVSPDENAASGDERPKTASDPSNVPSSNRCSRSGRAQ
jgi:hypothetical protein